MNISFSALLSQSLFGERIPWWRKCPTMLMKGRIRAQQVYPNTAECTHVQACMHVNPCEHPQCRPTHNLYLCNHILAVKWGLGFLGAYLVSFTNWSHSRNWFAMYCRRNCLSFPGLCAEVFLALPTLHFCPCQLEPHCGSSTSG